MEEYLLQLSGQRDYIQLEQLQYFRKYFGHFLFGQRKVADTRKADFPAVINLSMASNDSSKESLDSAMYFVQIDVIRL